MQRELQAVAQRHSRVGQHPAEKPPELSPAMGLIGTLVGLVQMLGNLEDPSTIGPSMAVALLTTFYGACLANMVFQPARFENGTELRAEDMLLNHLYVDGNGIDRPAGKPAPAGNADQHDSAAFATGGLFRIGAGVESA